MELPHFERATRRAFLRHGLTATGAVAAAGAVLAACSKGDADTFSAATAPAGTAAAPTDAVPSPTDTATTVNGTTPTSVSSAQPSAALGIAFTYKAADTSARVRNPYIAVWVEDDSGSLAALIGVWYSTRDAKYLRELTDFTAATDAVDEGELAALSGATRSAGQYQLQWDGRGLDGSALAGSYTLWVEAAREHGPHSVTSGPLSLDPATPTTIAGNGELSDVAVTVG